MADTYAEKLGHVGEKIDEVRASGKSRISHLVDRVEHAIDSMHAEVDEVRVQAGLAKLEARDATSPAVEKVRNLSLDAKAALNDLRDELERERQH